MKKFIFLAGVLVCLSGCVRKIDLWGLKAEFDQGLDMHVGYNSIDTVDDQRGVNSKAGAYRGSYEPSRRN